MKRFRASPRRSLRRGLGFALVLALLGSAVATELHSHPDGRTHGQSCVTCSATHHPQQPAGGVPLLEPVRARLVVSTATAPIVARCFQPFHSCLSRAPPA